MTADREPEFPENCPTCGRLWGKQTASAEPTNEDLAKLAATHKPPQSWHDEDMTGLVAEPMTPERLERIRDEFNAGYRFDWKGIAAELLREVDRLRAENERL